MFQKEPKKAASPLKDDLHQLRQYQVGEEMDVVRDVDQRNWEMIAVAAVTYVPV